MKKRFVLVLVAVVMVFTLAMPIVASAASESDIIAAINQGVTVNGQTKAIPAKYVNAVQKYLDANDLTAAQADTLIAAINDARSTWVATGELNFASMTDAQKQSLQDKAVAAASAIGAKLTIDGDVIKVVDPNGKVFSIDVASGDIKQTGYSSALPIAVASGLVVLLVAAFALTGKKRLLSSEA
ncbi:MAG: hypothetical protein LBL63_02110 [Clostridiales Family XIII bacterium]|jgi:hypothetical protein|nr:hypothetical protein [Clostridiales Family XIII bacterium]